MSTPQLFDSHAHITFPQYAPSERTEILARAVTAGVTHIMNVATDEPSLRESFDLTLPPNLKLYVAAATHPHDLKGAEDPLFETISSLAKSGKLSAIGETGLDFFHAPHTRIEQEYSFMRYAELATETNLPLIVHCRNAFPALIPLLQTITKLPKGVLHCFTGTKEEAEAVLDLGWYLSFSGIITYKKSDELRHVAAFVPLERLLIETDAPYLPPEPFRGKRNEPALITATAKALATIKNISFDEVATATCDNGCALFG